MTAAARAREAVTAVILAAGRGTRMQSDRAKVLHLLRGLPLVTWVVRAVQPLAARVVVVIGHQADEVRSALDGEAVSFAVQPSQQGTGHALECAAPEVGGATELLVLAGDVPLLRTATLATLLTSHRRHGAAATVLTFRPESPTGYGRIVRDAGGWVERIVEEREASPAERTIGDCNSGTFAFQASAVLERLHALPPRTGGERYLTDIVSMLRNDGLRVAAVEAPSADEAAGINTREQLAAAEALLAAGPGPEPSG